MFHRLIAALACLAASSLVTAGPRDFDVIGLKLGQDAATVEPVLRSIGPKARIGRADYHKSELFGSPLAVLHATVGNTGGYGYISMDFDEYVQVSFGQATGKAYLVMRRTGSLDRQPVLTTTLEEALLKKYGKPTYRSAGQMQWTYRADGSPATSGDMCSRQEIVGQGTTGIVSPPNEQCGVTLSVTYASFSQKPDLVGTFSIGMFDHQELIKDIREIQKREAERTKTINDGIIKTYKESKPKL